MNIRVGNFHLILPHCSKQTTIGNANRLQRRLKLFRKTEGMVAFGQ